MNSKLRPDGFITASFPLCVHTQKFPFWNFPPIRTDTKELQEQQKFIYFSISTAILAPNIASTRPHIFAK